jgi:hypothetical protein
VCLVRLKKPAKGYPPETRGGDVRQAYRQQGLAKMMQTQRFTEHPEDETQLLFFLNLE